MPLAELVRDWPLYFQSRNRLEERERKLEESKAKSVRTMGGGL